MFLELLGNLGDFVGLFGDFWGLYRTFLVLEDKNIAHRMFASMNLCLLIGGFGVHIMSNLLKCWGEFGGLWGTLGVFGDCSRLPRAVGFCGLYVCDRVQNNLKHISN